MNPDRLLGGVLELCPIARCKLDFENKDQLGKGSIFVFGERPRSEERGDKGSFARRCPASPEQSPRPWGLKRPRHPDVFGGVPTALILTQSSFLPQSTSSASLPASALAAAISPVGTASSRSRTIESAFSVNALVITFPLLPGTYSWLLLDTTWRSMEIEFKDSPPPANAVASDRYFEAFRRG